MVVAVFVDDVGWWSSNGVWPVNELFFVEGVEVNIDITRVAVNIGSAWWRFGFLALFVVVRCCCVQFVDVALILVTLILVSEFLFASSLGFAFTKETEYVGVVHVDRGLGEVAHDRGSEVVGDVRARSREGRGFLSRAFDDKGITNGKR